MTERERLATLSDCGWTLIAMACAEEPPERGALSVQGVIDRLAALAWSEGGENGRSTRDDEDVRA